MVYRVNVINQTMSGTYFLEGRARVIKTIDGDLRVVDFEDGSGPIERFVDPAAQDKNVGTYIADLNDAVHPARTPDQP